jgi:hypothetical protein
MANGPLPRQFQREVTGAMSVWRLQQPPINSVAADSNHAFK